MSQKPPKEEYSVGWICALPIELAAAVQMLDEEFETPDQEEQDTNLYMVGRIGEHKVVLACLPAGQTGIGAATAVAMQLKTTYKWIRFGLMVGIGGGVPGKEDVRLGDVVISQPASGHGGVIQYDFGKTTPYGFTRNGFLNAPPQLLLNAVNRMKTNHLLRRSKISEYIANAQGNPLFSRDAAGPDVLYEALYDHEGENSSCKSCDVNKVVKRQPRENNLPLIHYGTIASGNQVMRYARERDEISNEFGGVLCFEMEAAGLMNNFPCLVIRGICDYSDSHKNKKWQPYAALTAAVCAKEILSVIPTTDVAKLRSIEGVVFNIWNNNNSKIGKQVGTENIYGSQNITL